MKQLIYCLLLVVETASAQSGAYWPVPQPLYVTTSDTFVHSVPGFPEGSHRLMSMYVERKYGLKELTLLVIDSYLPIDNWAICTRAGSYGNLNYSLMTGSLGFIRSFGDWRAQAGFNLAREKISSSRESWMVSCRLSLFWRLQPSWWAALNLDQLASFSNAGQKPSANMQATIGYYISPQLSTSVCLQQDRQTIFSLHYSPVDWIFFKAGFACRPAGFSCLAGFSFGRYLLQIINSYHPLLGLSPAIAFSITW